MEKIYLSLIAVAITFSAFAQSIPNTVLQDRAVLPSNFLSQSTFQINTGTFWDASSRPAGALSEGCLVYQNVNQGFSNFSISLYSDLYNEDLYINTGIYGAAGANWKGWKKFLNSSNFSTYVLPLTGGNIDGNLGVGTTNTQGYKLAVNGSAIATSMTVKLYANWPDFVFKPSYRLPSLTDVKNYIDQNQHLPDMPSAEDVHANGLDLGEINRLLTKKVEELTLYLIEKDNQLTEQQQRMELFKEHKTHALN